MPKNESIMHSVLIVSASEQFVTLVKKSLPEQRFMTADHQGSVTGARRFILERYYNLVIINMPLPDENGLDFAMDLAQSTDISILLVVPVERFEDILDRVTDLGILVISKPIPRGRTGKAVRLLLSFQDRLRMLEAKVQKAADKLEEERLAGRAKCLLIEKKHMSESEAHRYIGKQAMDHGLSRKRIAQQIVEDLE